MWISRKKVSGATTGGDLARLVVGSCLRWRFYGVAVHRIWTGRWLAGRNAGFPYHSGRVRFEKIGNVVAGFLAGWAVSKVDRAFDLWIDPNSGPLLLDPTFSKRSLLCLTSFFLAATVTYAGRKYFLVVETLPANVVFSSASNQCQPPHKSRR